MPTPSYINETAQIISFNAQQSLLVTTESTIINSQTISLNSSNTEIKASTISLDGNIEIKAPIVSSQGNIEIKTPTFAIDGNVLTNGDTYINGNLYVYGNTFVDGTVTDNISYISTDKNLILANGASSSQADGSGIIIGNTNGTNFANIIYYNNINGLKIDKNLQVLGNQKIFGNLSISGNIVANTIIGNLVADNSRVTNGLTTGSLNVSGNITANTIIGNLVADNSRVTNGLTAGSLNVSGNIRATQNFLQGTELNYYVLLPMGAIIIWYGAIANIPTGWNLCDGGTYLGITTPDLRGRFVLGYGSGAGLTPRTTVGATGGAETVTLIESQIPSHSHVYYDAYFAENRAAGGGIFGTSASTDTDNDFYWRTAAGGWSTSPSPINTSSTGSSGSHENMPPFYVLAYIMKCF